MSADEIADNDWTSGDLGNYGNRNKAMDPAMSAALEGCVSSPLHQRSQPDTFHGFSISIMDQLHLFPLPVPPDVSPRPLTSEESSRVDTLGSLQFVRVSSRRSVHISDLGIVSGYSTDAMESTNRWKYLGQ